MRFVFVNLRAEIPIPEKKVNAPRNCRASFSQIDLDAIVFKEGNFSHDGGRPID